jgi:hypothetical protein
MDFPVFVARYGLGGAVSALLAPHDKVVGSKVQ